MEGIRGRRAESIIWDESANFSDISETIRIFSDAIYLDTLNRILSQANCDRTAFFNGEWEYSEFDDGSILPLESEK